MGKIDINYSKTLKLINACLYEVSPEQLENLGFTLIQFENYIKSKGAQCIGPIIQCTYVSPHEPTLHLDIQLIRQTTNYINNIDHPYMMEGVLRVKNCIYAHFRDNEQNIKYAYDKINLIAYEEGIELTGKFYTVFTSKEDEEFSADIFAEKSKK